MKIKRIYHTVAVSVASLVVGANVFNNKSYAEEISDDNSSDQITDEKNKVVKTGKVNQVVVEQSENQDSPIKADQEDSAPSANHKDEIWEPAPPLAKPEDAADNSSSNGVVRPHAQGGVTTHTRKHQSQKQSLHIFSGKHASTEQNISKIDSANSINQDKLNNDSNRPIASNNNSLQKSVKNDSFNHKMRVLPQTSSGDDAGLSLLGLSVVNLGMVGLIGVTKKSKNYAKLFNF